MSAEEKKHKRRVHYSGNPKTAQRPHLDKIQDAILLMVSGTY